MLGKAALVVKSKVALAVLGAVVVGGTGTAAVAVTASHTPITLPIVGQVGGSSQGQNGHTNKGNNSASSTHAHTIAILGTLQGTTTCTTNSTTANATQITQISVKVTTVSGAADNSGSDTSTSTSATTPTGFKEGQAATITVADGYTDVTGTHADSLADLCGATGQRVEVNATLQSNGTYKAWKVTVQGSGQVASQGSGQGSGQGTGQGTTGKTVHFAGTVGAVNTSNDSFTFTAGSSAGSPPAGIATGAPIHVTVTSQTTYSGTIHAFTDLKQGTSVMIDGTMASDGSVQAITITGMGR